MGSICLMESALKSVLKNSMGIEILMSVSSVMIVVLIVPEMLIFVLYVLMRNFCIWGNA